MNSEFCNYCDCDFTDEHYRDIKPYIDENNKYFCNRWCYQEYLKGQNK